MPFVEVAGQRLFYDSPHLLTSATPGARILLLHGTGVDHRLFDEQLRFFSAAHTPIALDLPGHGRSEGEAQEAVEGYRPIIEGFVRALRLAPVVLCGHALGAAIALDYAAQHQREIEGLVLADMGITFPTGVEDAKEFTSDPEGYRRRRARRGLREEALEPVAEKLATARGETSNQSYLRDLVASSRWDGTEALRQVHMPALIVFGEDDALLEQAGRLLELMPHASFDTIPLARHFPHLEAPDIFNDGLNRFLTLISDLAPASNE